MSRKPCNPLVFLGYFLFTGFYALHVKPFIQCINKSSVVLKPITCITFASLYLIKQKALINAAKSHLIA